MAMGSTARTCSVYVTMVVMQFACGGSNILIKIALEKGLSQLAFIVYRHLIAMLLLGPLAYVLERKQRPSLSLSTAAKIFVLSSLGTTIHLNVYYIGLTYTSPTVAGAMSNIIPGFIFLLAILLGMEQLEIRSTKGQAKVIGTLVCIGGALIFTFWKEGYLLQGFTKNPLINIKTSSANSKRHHKDDWIKGSLLILTANVAWSAWLILQAMVYKVYPAQMSLNTLVCFFASLQSSILALIFDRKSASWKLGWDVQLVTILYCGILNSGLLYCLQTWCISEKGPVFAAMFSPLLLVIVGMFSAIFFAERLHLGSIVGALLIVIGLYCVLWGKSKSKGKCGERKPTEGEAEPSSRLDHQSVNIDISYNPNENASGTSVEKSQC